MSSHTFNLFLDGCWMALETEAARFKAEYFKALAGAVITCPQTGVVLSEANSVVEPGEGFTALVKRYVGSRGVDEGVAYNASQNRQRFADLSLTADWRAYFLRRGEFRLVAETQSLHYEPSDSALAERAAIRAGMMQDGWLFGGCPK